MKKLIVLTVILALSTAANAALVSTNGPIATGAVSWDIVGDQLVGYNATGVQNGPGLGVADGAGGITVTGIGPVVVQNYEGSIVGTKPAWNAGDGTKVLDSIYWLGWDIYPASLSVAPTAATDWFVFDLSGTGGSIDLFDYAVSSTIPVDSLNVIPEPATIVLLGLGGLLLRRRK